MQEWYPTKIVLQYVFVFVWGYVMRIIYIYIYNYICIYIYLICLYLHIWLYIHTYIFDYIHTYMIIYIYCMYYRWYLWDKYIVQSSWSIYIYIILNFAAIATMGTLFPEDYIVCVYKRGCTIFQVSDTMTYYRLTHENAVWDDNRDVFGIGDIMVIEWDRFTIYKIQRSKSGIQTRVYKGRNTYQTKTMSWSALIGK